MRGMYEKIFQKHLLKWEESYWETFLPLRYQYTGFENKFYPLLSGRFQNYRKKFFYRDDRVFTKSFYWRAKFDLGYNHLFSNHSELRWHWLRGTCNQFRDSSCLCFPAVMGSRSGCSVRNSWLRCCSKSWSHGHNFQCFPNFPQSEAMEKLAGNQKSLPPIFSPTRTLEACLQQLLCFCPV